MKILPGVLRERLIYDRGSEMACRAGLARRLNSGIWLADAYAPWQRDSNESTNSQLRQSLPKSRDLPQVGQMQLAILPGC